MTKRNEQNDEDEEVKEEEESEEEHKEEIIQREIELYPSHFKQLVFKFVDECPKCKTEVYAEEIFSGWKRDYSNYSTRCPRCNSYFIAHLEVRSINKDEMIFEKMQFLHPPCIK